MEAYASNKRVLLFTGDGKGKTTAALGMALRAAGHGIPVCCIQFIKARDDTGEARMLKSLPGVELYICGEGFVGESGDATHEHHSQAARAGLALAEEKTRSGTAYGMLVLDEVCNAITLGLLDFQDVLDLLRRIPRKMIVVLTGRDAPRELIDAADTVSRIDSVKHGFDQGIPAMRGAEW